MALTLLQSLSIPSAPRTSDWVFSSNIGQGVLVGLMPLGSFKGTWGTIGYASKIFRIDGQNVIYPPQDIPLIANTIAMLHDGYVPAPTPTGTPYPFFIGIQLMPWITEGAIEVWKDSSTVFLARY